MPLLGELRPGSVAADKAYDIDALLAQWKQQAARAYPRFCVRGIS
ncbi:hypothetical protein ACKZDW_07030 [Ralstonia syzygii subsp. celebesensis]|uniref:Uncharacterized protein n=1 Tax=blood disease bacterium R229 TaxID=741978 RepID=G2ZSW8_9RALS|nr:hypothetical protein [Ralstonia syzygii]CCA82131.1 hypothetical protein BDB_180174 [blood disease bacterium R229]